MNFIYENHKHRLENLSQDLLSPLNLQLHAGSIHKKGAPVHNCWGFIDETVCPICRPQEMQRVAYNGHKRVHSIKFQPMVKPSGIIAMCLYSDPAYLLRVHLQGLIAKPTPDQLRYNKAMSQSRVAVEWVFGAISYLFAFLDFKKNLEIGLSSVGKM